MAQAQYDKFVALRKSGIDRQTARKQAYGDIPVAPPPVTTVAPTPTAPTPPLTPTQTIQWVNGETFQVAPTNAQWLSTPTQTPAPVQAQVTPPETTVASAVTPTPTPEVAPTPLDKTAEIKAKNEAQMALNKQKSELAIEDRKRQAEEAKMASIPTDEKGVLNAFMTWVSVPKQNTQAFRNAEFKYNNYKKFSTMTPTQLLDNMKMWEIGTETATLLAQNPNYIKAKEEFDKFQKSQSINNMIKSVVWGATGKTEAVDYYGKAQSDVAKKLWVNETNAEAFARIVWGNELVQTLTKTVSDTAKQLNTLNTERNAVYADLKKQYPDMSASAIMTLMWTRTKETTDQINALNSTLTLTQADLKDAMTMAQAEYGATQSDIALQAEIAKEQRTIDNALALNQAEFDQKIAQQAQAMNDPVQAINSVINQYAEQGIFAQKSAQQHIADAKAFIAKWGTLGQYISQMQKDFQEKDAYKAKFAETSKPTIQNFGTSDKPDYRQYNTKTGKWETISGLGKWSPWALPWSFTWDTTSYIASKEGFRDTAYQDSAWVWTIGYGTTKINGNPVQPWQKITQAEAQKQLESDIVKHSNWKNYIDENTLSPSQKTALASFEYNLWPWIWDKWAVNIINMIKSWDLTWAGTEMQKYVNAGWKRVQGLANRRAEEAQLLMNTGTKTGTEDIKMQALALVQGLWGTADERQAFADNVIKVAQRDNISLADAKKKLGYKSADDTEFAKARWAEYKTIKADTRDKLSNATTALTLLNSPQTAIGDVASIVGFLKTIDPASVARESEVDSVRNARGVIDSLSNQFASLKEGTKLTDSQRTQLKDSIQTIVNAGNAKYNEYVTDTAKEFDDRWLDATVYIPKKEIEKAKWTPTNTPVKLAKEAVLDIYNKWKSNKK